MALAQPVRIWRPKFYLSLIRILTTSRLHPRALYYQITWCSSRIGDPPCIWYDNRRHTLRQTRSILEQRLYSLGRKRIALEDLEKMIEGLTAKRETVGARIDIRAGCVIFGREKWSNLTNDRNSYDLQFLKAPHPAIYLSSLPNTDGDFQLPHSSDLCLHSAGITKIKQSKIMREAVMIQARQTHFEHELNSAQVVTTLHSSLYQLESPLRPVWTCLWILTLRAERNDLSVWDLISIPCISFLAPRQEFQKKSFNGIGRWFFYFPVRESRSTSIKNFYHASERFCWISILTVAILCPQLR